MDEARRFQVRVWRHPKGPRAAVNRLGEDSTQVFTEADRLGQFLLAGSDPPLRTRPPPAVPCESAQAVSPPTQEPP